MVGSAHSRPWLCMRSSVPHSYSRRLLGVMNEAAMYTAFKPLWTFVFISPGRLSRATMAGMWGKYRLDFIRNRQTIFQRGCALWHVHPSHTCRRLSFHWVTPLPHLFLMVTLEMDTLLVAKQAHKFFTSFQEEVGSKTSPRGSGSPT